MRNHSKSSHDESRFQLLYIIRIALFNPLYTRYLFCCTFSGYKFLITFPRIDDLNNSVCLGKEGNRHFQTDNIRFCKSPFAIGLNRFKRAHDSRSKGDTV